MSARVGRAALVLAYAVAVPAPKRLFSMRNGFARPAPSVAPEVRFMPTPAPVLLRKKFSFIPATPIEPVAMRKNVEGFSAGGSIHSAFFWSVTK